MANVKEILQRTPPRLLYHYTTQQGLLGIIRNKEIWASHTQYLNDAREFRHALDLVKEELSSMKNEAGMNEVTSDCLAGMEKSLYSGIEAINVCVCSFSEQGDMLSQWRAYGGASSGFAVGFSGGFLRTMSENHGWLVPVIYDEGQQRLLIRTLLGDVLEENVHNFGKNHQRPSARGGNLVAYLFRYAPILKHHSFAEEHEWRIITRPLMCSFERFDYRTGGSMLIPYFRLPLTTSKRLGIEEIIIGPTPHPEQSSHSVHGLLTKYDIPPTLLSQDGVTVRCSEIPYRSW